MWDLTNLPTIRYVHCTFKRIFQVFFSDNTQQIIRVGSKEHIQCVTIYKNVYYHRIKKKLSSCIRDNRALFLTIYILQLLVIIFLFWGGRSEAQESVVKYSVNHLNSSYFEPNIVQIWQNINHIFRVQCVETGKESTYILTETTINTT